MTHNIKSLIAAMLTENTGTHMLDSGGANGRAWQQNAGKVVADFEAQPTASLEIWVREWQGKLTADLTPTVNVFHKLTSGLLELDSLCNEFNSKSVDDWGSDLNGVSHSGEEWLHYNGFTWDDRTCGFNTYNWDNNFSQVLQGNIIKRDGETYVLLQIHGGADVRGGYTDAKLFKFDDHAEDYDLYRDDCGFGVDDGCGGLTLSWHGEWINGDGSPLDDDESLAFALAAGASLETPTVTIEGDGYFDF